MSKQGWFNASPKHLSLSAQFDTACVSGSGRVDAQKADATDRLPAEDFSADRLKQAFQQQGLSVQEFVALAGAHTVRPNVDVFAYS